MSRGRTGDTPIPDEDETRELALRALSFRARSRAELITFLTARDVPPDMATAITDRYVEVGLINDAEFADMLVRAKSRDQRKARRAIARDLESAGIDGHTAALALEQVSDDDEREMARDLVRKKLRSLLRYDDAVVVRRLVGQLARRGYASGLAFEIVREELREARTHDAI